MHELPGGAGPGPGLSSETERNETEPGEAEPAAAGSEPAVGPRVESRLCVGA